MRRAQKSLETKAGWGVRKAKNLHKYSQKKEKPITWKDNRLLVVRDL
jgi:hypothetical protein